MLVVDAGHGGKDTGATAGGLNEAAVNLSVAGMLARKAERHCPVLAPVGLVRPTRAGMTPAERQSAIRALLNAGPQPRAFVSVHCDSSPNPTVRGFSVWTTRGGTPSDALATAVWARLRQVAYTPYQMPARADYCDNDPDYEADFYVLRIAESCGAAAVLVELGFLSNATDRAILRSVSHRGNISQAILLGVNDWARIRA